MDKFNKLYNLILENNIPKKLTLDDFDEIGFRHTFFDLSKKIPNLINQLTPKQCKEFYTWRENFDEDEVFAIVEKYIDKAWLRKEKKMIRDLEKKYEDEDEIYRDDIDYHRITYPQAYTIFDALVEGAIKAPAFELLKVYWYAFEYDNTDEPDYDEDLDSIGIGFDLDTGE